MGTRSCAPSRPVSVLHFHGTADEFAPFAGGRGARSLSQTEFFSVEHTIATWVRANGCPKEPRLHEELPVTVDDGLQIFHTGYGPGREESEVELYVIAGGGHTWPGEEPTYDFLGAWTRQISANELMWAFFRRHSLPES
jgi:polyhydroxybutyrate depolymerase